MYSIFCSCEIQESSFAEYSYFIPIILFIIALFINYLSKGFKASNLRELYELLIRELIVNMNDESTRNASNPSYLNIDSDAVISYPRNTNINFKIFDKLPYTDLFESYRNYYFCNRKNKLALSDYLILSNNLNILEVLRNHRIQEYELYIKKNNLYCIEWGKENIILHEKFAELKAVANGKDAKKEDIELCNDIYRFLHIGSDENPLSINQLTIQAMKPIMNLNYNIESEYFHKIRLQAKKCFIKNNDIIKLKNVFANELQSLDKSIVESIIIIDKIVNRK